MYGSITVVSGEFRSKLQPARHRMVYGLLKDEMDRVGGIHALLLRTLTPDEAEKQRQREMTANGQSIAEIAHE